MRQLEGVESGDRARGRFGTVVVLLQPEQHRRVFSGGAEPATRGRIPELLVLLALQRDRPLEPFGAAARLKQFEESPDQIGIVLRIGGNRSVIVTKPPEQPAVPPQ